MHGNIKVLPKSEGPSRNMLQLEAGTTLLDPGAAPKAADAAALLHAALRCSTSAQVAARIFIPAVLRSSFEVHASLRSQTSSGQLCGVTNDSMFWMGEIIPSTS